ncbi:ABC transporter permease [Stackebrandtia nassauensis]|uniref:ABC transporter permease n=1 Tax=Stackebrandtia nassauensis (strain DSM 44728 / CIP 108903 / NRRL B-16338 / NBRC 102104 / LLR-40K-21) TaxID=446470 RepID=D3PZC1_STANL|nr:ABC transporter permease [Stackebrandtia nassauensis]ADD41595.1 hypothetical protein Snas_1899 [Stackebrandtia nassauensis DSM 44728]
MRLALHAEFTKLRTAPGTGGLLLAILIATVAVSALAGTGTSCVSGVCELDAVKHSLTGVQIGQSFVAVFAIAAIGGEYGNGMIHTTLTAVPRRLTVVAAKVVTTLAVIAVVAVAAVPAALLAGRAGLARQGHEIALSDFDTQRAVLGSIAYLLLIGVLSIGIALVARNATAAIGITLGLLYLFPLLAATVTNESLVRVLYRMSPMNAGLSIQATTGLADLMIAPLAGLGVLAAWAVAALVGGTLSLRFRDA